MKLKSIALTLTAFALWAPSVVFAAVNVTAVDFKKGSTTSEIQIRTDGPADFQMSEIPQDRQLVIELKGARITKALSRKLDTSSFDGQVSLISPYQMDGQDSVRIVVQLRSKVTGKATQNQNLLSVVVPNSADQASSTQSAPAAANDTPPANLDQPAAPPVDASVDASAGGSPGATNDENSIAGRKATTGDALAGDGEQSTTGTGTVSGGNVGKNMKQAFRRTALDDFVEAQETRHFIGKPITLKLRDAELADVFRMIAEASGFNIILGPEVGGKISMSLEGVPWDQALDLVLRTKKLGAERSNNVLRVGALTELTKEKEEELRARLASEASAPRVTRIFPISYANLTTLVQLLQKFATSVPLTGLTPQGAQSIVDQDARTNSVVVRDTAPNLEKMQKLISILDTQTPQVLIEGKVIEASEDTAKGITGNLGIGNQSTNNSFTASLNQGNPLDPLVTGAAPASTNTAIFPTGVSAESTNPGGNHFGFSPSFAFLPGNLRLNAILDINETESKLRIVSSPRVVVLDKESASVVESTPVLVNTLVSTANGPQVQSTTVQANLSLTVTPTVTNEGSVLLQISLSRDVPVDGTGVGTRNVTTKVLVDSGSTLVIGGIYTNQTLESSSGLPFLRKIPIIGILFGSDTSSTTRDELFFFVTPRVINPKEAGLT